ncbi:MFS transporter [Nocardia colli]|uniref:MFS transporter n=1 Tax=Nocardia colli TaxID=2545717 RepID=A0A5N0DXA6_9NOCA|nr:MFS transporter [Nocardia colli]KAA8880645.1 MFS transporter [Nocardia colli]
MAAGDGDPAGAAPHRTDIARLVALIAVVAAVAVNLRPGITTVGPELEVLTAHFGAGTRAAGVITAAPLFAFALVSLSTPIVLARISLRAGLYWALALIGMSLAVRPWSGLWIFVLATCAAAAGVGAVGVLLPAVIRAIGNTGPLIAAFTTALQAGSAIGFAAIVPLAHAFGSWQWALAVWAVLAPIGAVALWRSPAASVTSIGTGLPRGPANPIALLRHTETIGLAVFFGLQALVAFVVIGWLPSVLHDAGIGAELAGAYLGLLTCVAVPISFIVPPIVARSAHRARWLAGFSMFSATGILGFIVAPDVAPLAWSIVLGAGLSVFSLALTVITLRAESQEEVLLLSSAVQGVGYLIAAIGPYAFGVVKQFGDGWGLPLTVLFATTLVQVAVGFAVGDPNRRSSGRNSARRRGARSTVEVETP